MKSMKYEDEVCCREILRLLFSPVKKIWIMCLRLQCLIWRRPKSPVVVKRLSRSRSNTRGKGESNICKHKVHLNGPLSMLDDQLPMPTKPLRIATFNAALFAIASAVPKTGMHHASGLHEEGFRPIPRNSFPRSILRPSHPIDGSSSEQKKRTKSKARVSINLPDNEISLSQSQLYSSTEHEENVSPRSHISNIPMRSPLCVRFSGDLGSLSCSRTILEVLREVDADILALQDVKAAEEQGMQPLSDLATALEMKYVFGESWAPGYGNAILSRWPIKKWSVQKILDEEDIRNVLKATIEIPRMGAIDVYCTQLDYLDESWRVEQIKAIIQSSEGPHILAGGLNSLDRSDYSQERWMDIIKYYEDIGKPKPGELVMEFTEERGYQDAKVFAGECEPVVIVAKGQNVQGTCKYGTRVDYILCSAGLPYKCVPGSYSVISSKGTSDHQVVKVDLVPSKQSIHEYQTRYCCKAKQKVVRTRDSCSSGRMSQMMDR
ncbi:hypothetical protein Dimus_001388 [Dionaea muscipula]